jgi:hypothetical protein
MQKCSIVECKQPPTPVPTSTNTTYMPYCEFHELQFSKAWSWCQHRDCWNWADRRSEVYFTCGDHGGKTYRPDRVILGAGALARVVGWANSHQSLQPMECGSCPFARASHERDPVAYGPPNSSDNGEGYYDCERLSILGFWGKSPKCVGEQWLEWAKEELAALGVKVPEHRGWYNES